MLSQFEKKTADFVKANDALTSAEKVLLAVSGGADSTALLYAMCALKTEGILKADLLCAHINHQLREVDSDKDQDFVIAEAARLNIPVTTRRLDVRGYAHSHKLSIETAARELRIDTLLDIAAAKNCRRIATAHHKDDNAETVIQRLARGTGFRGLGGIWPVRNFAGDFSFVRPLLYVTRQEIIEYLNRRNLKWRRDKTNKDCRYRRNFIRHKLIPQLQQDSTNSIVEQLSQLAQAARKFYDLVRSSTEKLWPQIARCSTDNVVLDLNRFLPQQPAVKVELVRRSLTSLGSGERDLTQQHFERILHLAGQKTGGKKIVLPQGFTACREYGRLIFSRAEKTCQPDKQTAESIKAEVPGQTRFGDYLIEAAVFKAQLGGGDFKAGKTGFVEWFDLDKLKPPIEVRFRRTGERFWPLGLAEEKKVGKFLTASKVPQRIRKKLLIVADREKIIWVWPIRMSEPAKVDNTTRRILRLQITDAGIGYQESYS
ncbi:MAG: tRNA lysidine(34) synthetase TilS [Planctomycetota bacterium]|jgi:tRNA(Ile)-lysidine synthase